MKQETINCLIYSRVSTDQQSNESQIQDLKEYAKYMKYNILGVFQEKISGTTKANERTEFKAMLYFIESNNVDSILVWELSRLGRNLKDILETIDFFTERKINIYSKKENQNTLNEDKSINHIVAMTMGIMGSVAQYERTNIIERSKRGLHYHLKSGGNFSLSPYGYTSLNKKIVIDANEAEIVKRIYSMFVDENINSTAIARQLNIENIKTKKNGYKWSDVQVRDILHNTLYFGERKYSFGLVSVPAIIDKAIYLKAQEIFKTNANLNQDKAIFSNYLKSKITCGCCGLSYYQHARQTKKDFAYRCMSKRSRLLGKTDISCNNHSIGINILNSIVYMAIINELLKYSTENRLSGIIKNHNQEITEKKKAIKKNIKIYNNDLEKANKKLARLTQFLINETLSESEYLIQKELIKTEIDKLTSTINTLLIDENQLMETEKNNYYSKLAERLKEKDNIEASDDFLLLDVNTYRYYVKNIIKSVIIKKSSFNECELLTHKIKPIHSQKLVKITVNTLLDSYTYYTVSGFNQYTFELFEKRLNEIEIIKEVCQ